jgi:hypothetical protein
MRNSDGEASAPSFILPRGRDCVAMRKTHECHSEPQAKNLALPAIYQTEILRLSPQDDTEIPDDAGRKEVWLQLLERFERLELQFESVRMLI